MMSQEEKIRVFGLPIRPAFSYGLPSKRALKKKLGLKADLPSIILVGGGEGMGPVEKTVDAVANQIGSQAQLVVICGRNANLVSRLKKKYVLLLSDERRYNYNENCNISFVLMNLQSLSRRNECLHSGFCDQHARLHGSM